MKINKKGRSKSKNLGIPKFQERIQLWIFILQPPFIQSKINNKVKVKKKATVRYAKRFFDFISELLRNSKYDRAVVCFLLGRLGTSINAVHQITFEEIDNITKNLKMPRQDLKWEVILLKEKSVALYEQSEDKILLFNKALTSKCLRIAIEEVRKQIMLESESSVLNSQIQSIIRKKTQKKERKIKIKKSIKIRLRKLRISFRQWW